MHELLYNINNETDCILVTESWLNEDITDGMLDPNEAYSIIRADRTNGRGGGVCALIRKNLAVCQVELAYATTAVEIVCFDLCDLAIPYRILFIGRPLLLPPPVAKSHL